MVKACQAGANLVVGLLDFLLRGCTRYTEDLVEVLLAACRGTCVKRERRARMGRLCSCAKTGGKKMKKRCVESYFLFSHVIEDAQNTALWWT